MRLTSFMKAVLPCLLLTWLTSAIATENTPMPTPFDHAMALMDALRAKELPKPEPFGESEGDLFDAMANGHLPADPAFCERIKLIEITDGLLPVLNQPFFRRPGDIAPHFGYITACRLFALRGNLLCQQKNIAEGQAWLLKARTMARCAGGDQSLIALLYAAALEDIGLHNAAHYAGTWSEQDRLAYANASEKLPPIIGLAAAFRQDDAVLPKEHRASTLIPELKSLPPTQQEELIKKRFGPYVEIASDPTNYVQRYRFLFTYFSMESWEALQTRVAAELEPLTVKKLAAFAARNTAARRQVEADEAGENAAASTARESASKAEAIYRVLCCRNVEAIGRRLLDLQLRAKLLSVAMRKGEDFGETDLTGVTTADGKPLRLGTSREKNRKAILVGDEDFLAIGPIK